MFKRDYLKKIRVGYGFSQAKVARGIGLSPQVYNRYENGQRKLNLQTIEKLAEFYGLSIFHFLSEAPEKKFLPDWELELDFLGNQKRDELFNYSMVDLSYQFEELFIKCNDAYSEMRNAVKRHSKKLKKENIKYSDSQEIIELKHRFRMLKDQLDYYREMIELILKQKIKFIYRK